MVGRALGAGVLALLLAAGTVTAAVPEGPRLAAVRITGTAHQFRIELVTVGPSGGHPLRLAGGGRRSRPWPSYFFSSLSWSPDGERIAFSGIVGVHGGDNHELRLKLFTVRADGSGLHAIRGTRGASNPVYSPDGHTIAFTRSIDRDEPTTVGGKQRKYGFRGASIWTVDLLTGVQRQLTPWRDGLEYIASSFSPDGSTLLATHEDSRLLNESEPVALQLDGGGSRRLLEDGSSPVYSPDGSEIALVRSTVEYLDSEERSGSDLYVIDADGTGVRRLTHTPHLFESTPSWDPSGERLAYERFGVIGEGGEGIGSFGPMQVNADGSCASKMFSASRAIFFAPAWQPGPGREAGRIEC